MNVEKVYVTNRHPDYKKEIIEIVRSNLAPRLLCDRIREYHDNDIAAALELLKKEERCRLYRVLDIATLSDIFEYAENREIYIGELDIRRQAKLLEQFEVTTAVEYLKQLDKKKRNLLIDLMEEGTKKEIALSSSFDEDEIGSKMSTNYISVQQNISVRQAMKELIEQAAENDNISTIYVVDEDYTLVGAIDLKELIIARENTELKEIIMTSYPYVYASEQIEDCIERMRDYSEDSIPVLDENNRLKGVLTAQDMVELVNDVLGEDYARLGGLSAEEDLQEPVGKSVRKRLPCIVPMLFQKLGVDPAVASGPLITTVNDLVAVVTYYGTAWILLIGIMNF